MTIVIPMAGRGQRFIEAGYQLPKYLLESHGKTMLQWSVDSLPLHLATRLVFVLLKSHEQQFGVEAKIRLLYGAKVELVFVQLEETTRGQAETVLRAAPYIDPRGGLAIFNIDTMFASQTLGTTLQAASADGVLGCFQSREPRFSFAATDATGRIIRVVEKEAISEHALTGLYYFRTASDFIQAAEDAVRGNRLVKGEFYVAPLYNDLIAKGARLVLDQASVLHILGTPEEYSAFCRLDRRSIEG